MLGNPILNYVSFQATNNQINLDILSFVCILVAHQIDSRLLAQYLIDFLRISLLIMKRTMEPAVLQAHNQKYGNWAWWAGSRQERAHAGAAGINVFTGEQGASESADPIIESPLSMGQSFVAGWKMNGEYGHDGGGDTAQRRALGWRVRVGDPLCSRLCCRSLFPRDMSGLGFTVLAFHPASCKSPSGWPWGHWAH